MIFYPFEMQRELRRLREENRQLKMEREILKKATGLLRQGPEVRYRFIQMQSKAYPVEVLCRVMRVTRIRLYEQSNNLKYGADF